MPTVFVYGALMVEPYILEHGRAARVAGHEVAFVLPGIPLLEPRFAGLVRCHDSVAHGVVCDLDEARWTRMSAHEAGYLREWVEAETCEGCERVLALIAPDTLLVDPSWPSRRYARLLVEGARVHALPGEVVARYDEAAMKGPRASQLFPWVPRLVGRLMNAVGQTWAWRLMTAVGLALAGIVVAGLFWLVG